MLRDKCVGLTRVRNCRRSDSPSLACVATRIVARETGAGRNAACLATATAHTAGSERHARPRSTPALANLHCAPRQRIVIAPSDHLNNQKLSIRMWRAFLAALWLMPDAHAALGGADAGVAEQAGPHFGTGYRRQRDRSRLPHRLRSGIAAVGTTLHHRQSRRRRRNAGPCRGRQGRPRRLYAALPLALADDLPGDPQHAALRYRA